MLCDIVTVCVALVNSVQHLNKVVYNIFFVLFDIVLYCSLLQVLKNMHTILHISILLYCMQYCIIFCTILYSPLRAR